MKTRKREIVWGWVFVFPALVLFLITVLLPTIVGFIMSFYKWSLGARVKQWIGFENFINLAKDQLFFKSLLNTFYYTLVSVPAAIIIALLLAMLLNSELVKNKPFFRTIFFIPYITPLIAVAFVFRLMFHPSLGLINNLLNLLGMKSVGWLESPKWAMLVVILFGVWRNVGFFIVIFLAALQGLPKDVIESSIIDGAAFWNRFRFITLPLLNSSIVFSVIIGTIGALQLFTEVVTMTGGGTTPPGGPLHSTYSVVLYIYQTAVRSLDMGYGATLSIGLFFIMFIIMLIQLKITQKPVEY